MIKSRNIFSFPTMEYPIKREDIPKINFTEFLFLKFLGVICITVKFKFC